MLSINVNVKNIFIISEQTYNGIPLNNHSAIKISILHYKALM